MCSLSSVPRAIVTTTTKGRLGSGPVTERLCCEDLVLFLRTEKKKAVKTNMGVCMHTHTHIGAHTGAHTHEEGQGLSVICIAFE